MVLNKYKRVLVGASLWLMAIVVAFGIAWRRQVQPPQSAVSKTSNLVAPGDQQQQVPDRPLTEEEIKQTRRLRNLGIAQIENGDFSAAEQTFLQLLKLLPSEPLAARNLLISTLLKMQSAPGKYEAFGGDLELRRQVFSESLTYNGEIWIVSYLAGLLLETEGDIPAAIEEYRDATFRSSSEIIPFYALFRLLSQQDHTDNPIAKRSSLDSIIQAANQSPSNSFLQLECLRYQSQLMEKDLVMPLTRLEQRVQEFPSDQNVASILEKLVRIRSGVSGKDWDEVQKTVREVTALLTTHPEVIEDKKYLTPHLSSFVLRYFNQRNFRNFVPQSVAPAIDLGWTVREPEGIPEFNDLQDLLIEDFDLDGLPDVCVLRSDRIEIYHRESLASPWKQLSTSPLSVGFERIALADLDQDYSEIRGKSGTGNPQTSPPVLQPDSDLVVYGPGGLGLVENRWDPKSQKRELISRTETSGLDPQEPIQSLGVADLNSDGILDLVVATSDEIRILENQKNFRFKVPPSHSGLPMNQSIKSLLPIDVDQDQDLDLLVLGENGSGVIFQRQKGQFVWQPFFGRLQRYFSNLVDADCSGFYSSRSLSVVLTDGIDLQINHLVVMRDLVRMDIDWSHTVPAMNSQRLRLADFDNNGEEDVLSWNSQGVSVWMTSNGSDGDRREESEHLNSFHHAGEILGADFCDLDLDGDLDLVWGDTKGLRLAMNEGGNKNQWMEICLYSQPASSSDSGSPGGVNSFGIGSLIELKTATSYQSAVARRSRTHLGLGQRKQSDILRIQWANGAPFNLFDIPSNQVIYEQAGLHIPPAVR